ncbi:MAG: LysR family transcriptional regulator [Pseudomonadota bacterium]
MSEREGVLGSVRWDDLAAFLAVARAGGLAAATRSAAQSAPTLGRRMRELERAIGRELFVRRSHGYDLTDAGVALLREVEEVARRISHATAGPTDGGLPLIKVSAGTWTSLALARQWQAIVGDPADVRLRFVSSEAVLSLNRREASIAVRNRRPTEQGLAGRKLGRNEFSVYSAPGAPDRWILHRVDTPSSRWAKAQAAQDMSHEVSHPRLALDLALAGAGRIVLPTFIGDQEPTLERRRAPIPELSHDAWLVAHDDDRHLPDIRRVIDRIAELRS